MFGNVKINIPRKLTLMKPVLPKKTLKMTAHSLLDCAFT